jgi:tetratricopeptide (TPR) repeat protein
VAFAQPVLAQGQSSASRTGGKEKEAPPQGLDTQTAKVLSEAIELLNMENYVGAGQKIATLKLDKLSPYERSMTKQILFQVSYSQEKYGEAREHLKQAIDAGGLNEQQVSDAKYQSAQLFIQEEKWKEGAAAIEDWLKTATKPNSAAYYLLAAAYYQMEDYNRALPPAKKAVELAEKPQENWLGMLSALYLQKDQYKDAIPVLEQLVALAPSKKTYWMQLSSVYGQLENYPQALAVMQVAYTAGLVTDDQELRRLADLLMFNDVPYRCAQVLEGAIEKKVNADDKLYELRPLDCSGELEKSFSRSRGAESAGSGDLYVRSARSRAARGLDRDAGRAPETLDKGQPKIPPTPIFHGYRALQPEECGDAKPWFQRARGVERAVDGRGLSPALRCTGVIAFVFRN